MRQNTDKSPGKFIYTTKRVSLVNGLSESESSFIVAVEYF